MAKKLANYKLICFRLRNRTYDNDLIQDRRYQDEKHGDSQCGLCFHALIRDGGSAKGNFFQHNVQLTITVFSNFLVSTTLSESIIKLKL